MTALAENLPAEHAWGAHPLVRRRGEGSRAWPLVTAEERFVCWLEAWAAPHASVLQPGPGLLSGKFHDFGFDTYVHLCLAAFEGGGASARNAGTGWEELAISGVFYPVARDGTWTLAGFVSSQSPSIFRLRLVAEGATTAVVERTVAAVKAELTTHRRLAMPVDVPRVLDDLRTTLGFDLPTESA